MAPRIVCSWCGRVEEKNTTHYVRGRGLGEYEPVCSICNTGGHRLHHEKDKHDIDLPPYSTDNVTRYIYTYGVTGDPRDLEAAKSIIDAELEHRRRIMGATR
jgi:hypothetical protein